MLHPVTVSSFSVGEVKLYRENGNLERASGFLVGEKAATSGRQAGGNSAKKIPSEN